MTRLKVDFDEIQKAMEDVARDRFDYFFDRETGEAMTLSGEILGELEARLYGDDSEEIGDEIEYIEYDEEPEIPDWMEDEAELALEILLDEEGRYVRIPERKSTVAHQSMSEFIETVDDAGLREKLSASLNGRGAFRRFKDALIKHSKERKRWHGHNAKAMRKEIAAWLDSLGIEPAA